MRWRNWIINGRVRAEEIAITAHLGAHPKDAEAWTLLADSPRKQGKWASVR